MTHLTFLTPTRRAGARKVRCAVAAVLAVAGLSACGGAGPSTGGYCDAVKAHQAELSKVVGSGGATWVLEALPIFRDLRAQAPSDIRGDWDTVVGRLATLQTALHSAGVDPKTYDAKHPPASVSAQQRRAITDAATQLGSTATLAALDAVQQQARDVCHTPLSL